MLSSGQKMSTFVRGNPTDPVKFPQFHQPKTFYFSQNSQKKFKAILYKHALLKFYSYLKIRIDDR